MFSIKVWYDDSGDDYSRTHVSDVFKSFSECYRAYMNHEINERDFEYIEYEEFCTRERRKLYCYRANRGDILVPCRSKCWNNDLSFKWFGISLADWEELKQETIDLYNDMFIDNFHDYREGYVFWDNFIGKFTVGDRLAFNILECDTGSICMTHGKHDET